MSKQFIDIRNELPCGQISQPPADIFWGVLITCGGT